MSVPNESKIIPKNKRHLSGRQAAREILVICITTRITSQMKERLYRLLAGTVDWEYLLLLVEFHNIAPLIYNNILTNHLGSQIPKSFLERLRITYNETLYRNVILSDELSKVISAFDKHDIPVITLKGLALAEMLYDNLVARPMSDIDILVQPDDVWRADSLLKEMGYEQPTSSSKMTHPFHGVPYSRPEKSGIPIELHWTLEDERLISIPREKIWERSQMLTLQSGETRVLSLEDTLIFSTIQLYKEFDQFKVLSDIAELIKKYEEALDWNYIIDAAHSWRIGTIIYYSLKRAKDLLKAPVPLAILEELKPRAWHRWLIEFFSGHEAFLAPMKSYKLRVETLNIVCSLMMSDFRQALLVLEKYRGEGIRGGWLRTTTWIIMVSVFALWRNIAGGYPAERYRSVHWRSVYSWFR